MLFIFQPYVGFFNNTWAYVNKITLDGTLNSFRMGTGCQKSKPCD